VPRVYKRTQSEDVTKHRVLEKNTVEFRDARLPAYEELNRVESSELAAAECVSVIMNCKV
jgi:hypothetical protein